MSTFPFRTLGDMGDLRGRRVFVRVALDVPVGDDGIAPDHYRIARAIPTMQYLAERGAKVILATHLGRNPENSTRALLPALRKYGAVTHVDSTTGVAVREAVEGMERGTVLLLGNLRAHEGEEANDPQYAASLASIADYYVNDAFPVSHRAHASIVGVPALLPSFAGITFEEEYRELRKALTPTHPSLFILGGAKFETKEPLVQAYAQHYTNTFIGGALANDFMKGRGCEVGSSLLSPIDLSGSPLLKNEHIITPTDVVAVAQEGKRVTSCMDVRGEERVLDIGPATVAKLAPHIEHARTILWNGPLGNCEEGYAEGTKAVAELVAKSGAHSIVGGGDTVAAIESLGLVDSFGFLSTAGGAMLQFLEKKTLPGIDALSNAK